MTWQESPDRRLTPEMELLLCCARPRLDAQRAHEVANLVARGLDWNRILAVARPHGLAPLMFQHWSALDSPGVPSFALDTLRIAFERGTRQDLSILRDLFDLLDVFEAHQIPAVPYKGPVLALQLYGHPGARPCCDLDILVRPCDVMRVIELLLERRYRPLQRPEALEDEIKYRYHPVMMRADGAIVEIHWAILPRFFSLHLDSTDIWRSLTTDSIAGTTAACADAGNSPSDPVCARYQASMGAAGMALRCVHPDRTGGELGIDASTGARLMS